MMIAMQHDTKDLIHIALDLTTNISSQDRFERLLTTMRKLFNCDASALLEFKGQHFKPLAINGLSADVLGRQFNINEHPRLEAIARAGDVVRFPADSDLPDPYDALITSHQGDLHVHACVGLPLMANQRLIGALTIDGFNPHQFDNFSNDELRTVSALAAATLNIALLMDKLEKVAGTMTESDPATHHPQSNTEIIGQSAQIKALKKEISVVASTDMTALILGETGVGKELVATAIHQQSSRADKPLIYLNCAALPESIAESELFGHVKGAFTGAISNRSGKFELADKGTLFLDEIGELTLTLQAKLLRVLQYGDLQRIGDDRNLKVDTRIIAATNKDLKEEVLAGRFRADLYHRLSVFPIMVSPLRERGEDILLLAGFFMERCRSKLQLSHLSLSTACQSTLMRYPWPGNIRELEHSINRAAILAKAEAKDELVILQPAHFRIDNVNVGHSPFEITDVINQPTLAVTNIPVDNLREATEQFQRQLITNALQENNNNWAATARQLSIDVGNLHRLAKRIALKQ
ncbi:nitric oxide reductase transcriptional regulator NorR [Moritella marina ATCC 15381]|uniref:Nitric oxide reductase transcriptional regulator NorR n=1 Tax=Moritella marina ATCC 15381 TaxID=1202962 RepID=A0A5J6WJH1_MORMI|nr:nitric oxide reductase transcriptional regulator NorR [Moritella marina]QFI36532.1 nitric oxide reductase transcriptional regulator NorR [Moritella marina ATCC 15381]